MINGLCVFFVLPLTVVYPEDLLQVIRMGWDRSVLGIRNTVSIAKIVIMWDASINMPAT